MFDFQLFKYSFLYNFAKPNVRLYFLYFRGVIFISFQLFIIFPAIRYLSYLKSDVDM